VIIIFYSVVVILRAKRDGIIPIYPGKKIHGLFFNILKNANEELAYRLHSNINNKAFTVSSFLGHNIDEPMKIINGRKYYIRITFLEDNIFNLFTTIMLKNKVFKKEIAIENIEFSIVKILFDKTESKWSGFLTSEELLNINDYNNKITLNFYTPTLFRDGDKHVRYPVADKIFISLFNKFNKYSTFKLDEKIKDEFSNIEILRKRIRRKKVFFNNFYLEGFTGDVEFVIPESNLELIKTVNILSEFAFYSGVGYKTTMGLGQVRREGLVNV
jgi:CRISPR-associated endoribonuclease Cas6